MQAYSDPERENDPYALPDVEVFQLTAAEVATMDEERTDEYLKRHELSPAVMNSEIRQRVIDTMIKEEGITGGWFYWFCFPGCLPDSDPIGPFSTQDDALQDARDVAQA